MAATAAVAASARFGTAASPPVTSRRDTSVTTAMCAETTAAAGSALATPCAPAPIITSSPRQADMLADATGVAFSRRS